MLLILYMIQTILSSTIFYRRTCIHTYKITLKLTNKKKKDYIEILILLNSKIGFKQKYNCHMIISIKVIVNPNIHMLFLILIKKRWNRYYAEYHVNIKFTCLQNKTSIKDVQQRNVLYYGSTMHIL